ncbi:hypothetical protein CAMSH0001_0413 [Campylobacter showae RM3277]|uniref:Uncharacterized protein n=1 Tax=Campylobacter showae RM3277 TaxID=553219 RepID=C6RFA8_9BACT|nr:hypothetical protein CAMSH0001_0413 [Campylobacter showae RM3277]
MTSFQASALLVCGLNKAKFDTPRRSTVQGVRGLLANLVFDISKWQA